MTNFFKRFVSMLMVAVMCIASNTTVFAAEIDDDVIVTETTTIPDNAQLIKFELNAGEMVNVSLDTDGNMSVYGSLSGYNKKTFSGNHTSFTVNVSGDSSVGCGMTLKATSPDNSAFGYVSVKKPNSDEYYKNSLYLDCLEEKFVQIYFAKGGVWTIDASNWYNPANSVSIEVWIYA